MMFNSDISNDYSFLMHNIEGKMSSAATSNSNKGASSSSNNSGLSASATPSASAKLNTLTAARENIASNTGLKRKRTGEITNDDSDDDHFMTSLRNSSTTTSTGRSSSAILKLQAQLDEYKILNEQLKEQLRSYKDEHELFKDQSIRQLKYLEESSARYKSQYEQTSSKYYKEKKEWQARTRELDHSVQQLKQQLAVAQVGDSSNRNTGATASRAVMNSRIFDHSLDEDLQQEVLDLKEKYMEKQKEANDLLSEKLELEKKVYKFEQEAKTIKAVTQGSEDDAAEVRSLRKKCNELETILRRKSKEYEKYDQKLKNQTMLEEELSSVQQKLSLAQNTLKTYHNMEVDYGKYQEEKKVWGQLFSAILKDATSVDAHVSPSSMEASALGNNNQAVDDCTPTKVLGMFSDLQKKHLLLVQQHKDAELAAVQLRRQVFKAESQGRELTTENQTLKDNVEKLQSKMSTMMKQSKCFDSEINSLRSLLKTFDAEFSIGKPDAAKMLALKDSLINELRAELDVARTVITDYSQKIGSLEADLENIQLKAKSSATAVVVDEDLQKEVAELKSDYEALQEITGMDFLPHKTQVLHLAQNPSSILKSRPGYEGRSSLPMDVMRHLKSQIHTLTKQVNTAAAVDQMQSSIQPSDISVMMDQQFNKSTVDPNKMNQRLKEIFKEKISTFREAVYLLTGFKVDLTSADPGNPKSLPHIKLRSMYAETPDDALLFQLRDNAPELLETDFANNLDPTLMMYLTNYNSVPAFLAAITLQLFESQTQM